MPCSTTPQSGSSQAVTAQAMLPSTQKTVSASETVSFRGSITRPGNSLCTLRSQGRPWTTQHSVPADCQSLPGRGNTCQVPPRDFHHVIRYMIFLSSRLCLAHSPLKRQKAFLSSVARTYVRESKHRTRLTSSGSSPLTGPDAKTAARFRRGCGRR